MIKNVLAIVFILLVLGLAVLYIVKSKKKGKKCVGCPYSGECSKCAKSILHHK